MQVGDTVTQSETQGERSHRKIVEALETGFKWDRSFAQICLHEAMLEACLPHIYGDDWARFQHKVCEEIGVSRVRLEVLACMPRRHGKTVAIDIAHHTVRGA